MLKERKYLKVGRNPKFGIWWSKQQERSRDLHPKCGGMPVEFAAEFRKEKLPPMKTRMYRSSIGYSPPLNRPVSLPPRSWHRSWILHTALGNPPPGRSRRSQGTLRSVCLCHASVATYRGVTGYVGIDEEGAFKRAGLMVRLVNQELGVRRRAGTVSSEGRRAASRFYGQQAAGQRHEGP